MSLQDKALANHGGFKRLARRFHAARRGNIALMTALLMMPIMGLMGLAVDYGNALYVKSRLDQAAQAAASAAATTARNYMQSQVRDVDGYNQIVKDAAAVSEGNYVGGKIFGAQFGALNNGTWSTPTVSVKRVANTFMATVTYSATLNTYFARMFGVPVFNLAGTRSIIIGMLDTPTPASSTAANAVIDEKWVTAASVQTSDTSKPVINDWYSGTAGSASPLSSNGGPTIRGAPSARMQVGNASGTIPPILSKKVYLPAGNYELRYWYQSTVVYPEYEPVFICGSAEGEMHWATSSTTRPLNSSPSAANVLGGVSLAQSARAGVYLVPVLGNPQLDTTAPSASSFPMPPNLPYNAVIAPANLRADNSSNRIDICAYSSRWIQRSISIQITDTGYFWLSFIAEPPASTRRINGFYLGPVKLCQDACGDDLNNNWPWAAGAKLYDDSFESPSRSNGATFDVASLSGFTSEAKYELPAGWAAGRYGGDAAGAWDPASFVYETPTAYDGSTSIRTKRLGIWLYRRMLLMPGVYKINFMANMKQPLPTMQWCSATNSLDDGSVVTNWQLQDTSVQPCACPIGAITTIVMSDETISAQANARTNNTAPAFYINRLSPSGTAMSDCHVSGMVRTDQYCVLVPRTQYYGFQLRVQGPYDTTVTGAPNPGLDLGTGGAFLDKVQVTLLSQGVKNKFTGTPADPGDFENYYDNCKSELGTQSSTPTAENIISGGVPVWPGRPVPNPAYTTQPVRLIVTAPSK